MIRRGTPEIKTERLFLRGLAPEDASAVYAYRSDSEAMRYQTWHPASRQEVEEFIRDTNGSGFNVVDSWFQLGIYRRNARGLIGDAGIHFLPPDNRQAEIGFTVDPGYQHQGYATEAVRGLLRCLFESLGKHRVVASVDPDNLPSIRLLERVRMRREAHFRQSLWTGKDWADDLVYALLETEWQQRSQGG